MLDSKETLHCNVLYSKIFSFPNILIYSIEYRISSNRRYEKYQIGTEEQFS